MITRKQFFYILAIIIIASSVNACSSDPEVTIEKAKEVVNEVGQEEATELCDQVLEMEPSNASVLLEQALIYQQKGAYEEADRNFKRWLALDPDQVHIPQTAEVYFQNAFEHMEGGELAQAVVDYEIAIRLGPEQKVYEEVIDDLADLIEVDPDSAIPYYLRAKARYEAAKIETGKLYKVSEDVKMAIEKDLEKDLQIELLFLNADVHRQYRSNEKEIENYTAILELDPLNTVAYIDRADAYMVIDDYEEAIDDYKKALEMEPCNLDAASTLCYGIPGEQLCEPEPALSEEDEVAIYLAVINRFFADYSELSAAHVVYIPGVKFGIFSARDDLSEPNLIGNTIRERVNQSLAGRRVKVIWGEKSDDWSSFIDPFRPREMEADAILTLGDINSPGGGILLVSTGYHKGPLWGRGKTYVLEQVDGDWLITGIAADWIS